MAQSTAEIEAELVLLRAAAAEGVLSVRHSDGREVTFQSLDALEAAIARREERLASASGQRRRRTMRVFQSGRGL